MERKLIILFANDTIVSIYPTKLKGLLPIGNIPCISLCIKSFIEALKDNIDFVIVLPKSFHQDVQTEIVRWYPQEEYETIQFLYHHVETYDNRHVRILDSILKTTIADKIYDYVFITDCSFPLLGNEVIKTMIVKKNSSSILVGNFSDKKFALSRKLLDGVHLSETNEIQFDAIVENNKIYPYYSMNTALLSFLEFKSRFENTTENVNYYHLHTWNPIILPSYLMKFEGIPFMLCNDRIYLDNLYWKKKNVEHLQYINSMWIKWNNISSRMENLEKKIENMKSQKKTKSKD